MSNKKIVEEGSFAKMEGRRVMLGNSTLRAVWTEFLGEYRARVGGGRNFDIHFVVSLGDIG